MTQPSFVSVGTIASGTGSVSPGAPAGSVADDVWYLFAESNPAEEVDAPSADWTAIGTPEGFGNSSVAGNRLTVFRHVYTGVAPTLTVPDAGNHVGAFIIAVRDADPDAPEAVVSSNGDGTLSTALSTAAVTADFDEGLAIIAFSNGIDTTTAQFSGWANGDLDNVTERVNANWTAGGGGGIGVITGEIPTAREVAATTVTAATATSFAHITIIVQPVGANHPTPPDPETPEDDPWGIVAARPALTQPVGSVTITTSDNPQAIIDSNGAGTVYWFDDGVYNLTESIKPKDGDELWANAAILDGGAEYSQGDRYTDGSDVYLTGVEFGIDIKQGTGDNGVAVDVVVRGFEVRNFTKQGIRMWLGSDVRYCLLHDCLQNGIGGGFGNVDYGGYQAQLRDCVVWDNGSVDELGRGGGGCKVARTGNGNDARQDTNNNTSLGVIPSDPNHGMYMNHVLFWRNIGNGYWADVTSGGDLIEDCVADANTRKGFFVLEVSVGPSTIQDCTAYGNATWLYENPRTSSDAGIVTETSLGVTITGNRIESNGANKGIRVGEQGNRIAQHGHGTDDITVTDNNMRDSDAVFIDPDADLAVPATGNTDQGAGVGGASWSGTFDTSLLEDPPVVPPSPPVTIVTFEELHRRSHLDWLRNFHLGDHKKGN